MPLCYLYLDLPKNIMRNLSSFHLRAQTLTVEFPIRHSGNNHCDKCSCAAVQNEVHVLFHCQDLFVCALRKKYLFFFPFCQSFSVEAPYTFHVLSQTVFDFLSQWHNKLCHFISDIMDYFFWLTKVVKDSLHQVRRRSHQGPKHCMTPPPATNQSA